MGPFVDLEIFGPGKNFSTARKRTRERLFPGVDTNVVDQLVLCLERFPNSRAIVPKANMVRYFRSSDVFDGYVSHNLVHRTKNFIARLFWRRLLRLDPLTTDFLLEVLTRLPHVSEKSSSGRSCCVRMVCRHSIARVHRVGRIHLVMLG